MEDIFSRSEALLGAKGMEALSKKRVILFGVGGVGSWCAEALVRTGLTHLTIVDDDVVQPSNINRQLPATRETIGQKKVEALKARLLEINPEAEIVALQERYKPNPTPSLKGREPNSSLFTDESFDFQLEGYDYVIDAIDSVADKTDLLLCASRVKGAKVFSSMGAALRFDPTQVRVAELFDVKGDALAKAVRERMRRLQRHPNKKIRCVYSLENGQPTPAPSLKGGERIKGSLMQVTAVFGCTLASLVIKDVVSGTPN